MRIFQVRLTPARSLLLGGLILLSLIASVSVAALMPAKYTAKAQAVLIGPTYVGGKPTNPFLQFSQALSVTLDVLIVASSDPSAVQQIVNGGGTSSYTVSRSHEISDAEPIVDVTSKAPTPEQAITTTRLVVNFLGTNLQSRQAAVDVAPSGRVKLVEITKPDKASRVWKTPIEIAVAVLVLGVVGSLILFVLIDRYSSRRRPRKTATLPVQTARERRPVPGRIPLRRAGRAGPKERIDVSAQLHAGNGSLSDNDDTRPHRRRRKTGDDLARVSRNGNTSQVSPPT